MRVHPVIARAIQRHEPGATVEFHTSEPFVRSSTGKAYFTKVGSRSEREQFDGEAECLKAMDTAAPGLAPKLIECGVVDEETAEYDADVGKPYFVSEYKKMSALTETSAKKLAKRIATELHTYKGTKGFGFEVPTFCGRTKQDNGWYDTWEACYDALIGGLLSKLEAQGGYEALCKKGEQVRSRCVDVEQQTLPCLHRPHPPRRVIPALLGPLVVQPVLLHGDLWVSSSQSIRLIQNVDNRRVVTRGRIRRLANLSSLIPRLTSVTMKQSE